METTDFDHESGYCTFSCGHGSFVSGNNLPDHFDEPCSECRRPPANPEWVPVGAWCRKSRQKNFNPDNESTSIGGIAKSMGITKSDLMNMEAGRTNPRPLKDFWDHERK